MEYKAANTKPLHGIIVRNTTSSPRYRDSVYFLIRVVEFRGSVEQKGRETSTTPSLEHTVIQKAVAPERHNLASTRDRSSPETRVFRVRG